MVAATSNHSIIAPLRLLMMGASLLFRQLERWHGEGWLKVMSGLSFLERNQLMDSIMPLQ
ncbi:hypothetical protein DOX67_19590 [Cronobacter sakazakii]|nr:hypothetical protein [Cronobacter sakazakii]EGT4460458.1 hypothetical protein [Cronobacter sakazakii]